MTLRWFSNSLLPTNLLNHLDMTLTDVPQNGYCFYTVILLFLTMIPDPIPTYIPQLRQQIANFFNSRSGKAILKINNPPSLNDPSYLQ